MKNKVEVGDLWTKYGEIYHITEVGENFISFVGKYNNFYFSNTLTNPDPRYVKFTKIFNYLGKAKVSIDDLFEAQDVATCK